MISTKFSRYPAKLLINKQIFFQVIPFGISVDIFASKVYSRPNDIGFDTKLTVSSTYNPALFFRGIGHMFVTVKPNDTSSSCSGTFTVLIKKIDTISGNYNYKACLRGVWPDYTQSSRLSYTD